MANDDAVIATNDDAAQCKRFAVEKGYWVDPYIPLFVSRSENRHAPEINRGYYARVRGMRVLLDKFLRLTNQKCQVVNLGAGFDTTYWQLKDTGLAPTSFIEVDFPMVTANKCHFIKRKKQLLEKLSTEDGEIKFDSHALHAADYHLVGANLRNIEELDAKLRESDIDFTLPTVFIAECVLVYIDCDKSSILLKWIADHFSASLFITYEQDMSILLREENSVVWGKTAFSDQLRTTVIHNLNRCPITVRVSKIKPVIFGVCNRNRTTVGAVDSQVNMVDRFGEIMMDNLKMRGCVLSGVQACASLDSQKQRFLSQGWDGADAMEISHVYSCLPQADLRRIERLEFLDERELMDQLFHHYCFTWAFKDPHDIGLVDVDFS